MKCDVDDDDSDYFIGFDDNGGVVLDNKTQQSHSDDSFLGFMNLPDKSNEKINKLKGSSAKKECDTRAFSKILNPAESTTNDLLPNGKFHADLTAQQLQELQEALEDAVDFFSSGIFSDGDQPSVTFKPIREQSSPSMMSLQGSNTNKKPNATTIFQEIPSNENLLISPFKQSDNVSGDTISICKENALQLVLSDTVAHWFVTEQAVYCNVHPSENKENASKSSASKSSNKTNKSEPVNDKHVPDKFTNNQLLDESSEQHFNDLYHCKLKLRFDPTESDGQIRSMLREITRKTGNGECFSNCYSWYMNLMKKVEKYEEKQVKDIQAASNTHLKKTVRTKKNNKRKNKLSIIKIKKVDSIQNVKKIDSVPEMRVRDGPNKKQSAEASSNRTAAIKILTTEAIAPNLMNFKKIIRTSESNSITCKNFSSKIKLSQGRKAPTHEISLIKPDKCYQLSEAFTPNAYFYRKPYLAGWKREVVLRRKVGNQERDVYYYTPKGDRCRSISQVRDYLKKHKSEGLQFFCFDFRKNFHHLPPQYEIIRNANKMWRNKGISNLDDQVHEGSDTPGSPGFKGFGNCESDPDKYRHHQLHDLLSASQLADSGADNTTDSQGDDSEDNVSKPVIYCVKDRLEENSAESYQGKKRLLGFSTQDNLSKRKRAKHKRNSKSFDGNLSVDKSCVDTTMVVDVFVDSEPCHSKICDKYYEETDTKSLVLKHANSSNENIINTSTPEEDELLDFSIIKEEIEVIEDNSNDIALDEFNEENYSYYSQAEDVKPLLLSPSMSAVSSTPVIKTMPQSNIIRNYIKPLLTPILVKSGAAPIARDRATATTVPNQSSVASSESRAIITPHLSVAPVGLHPISLHSNSSLVLTNGVTFCSKSVGSKNGNFSPRISQSPAPSITRPI